MADETEQKQSPMADEARRLIRKQIDDFSKHVAKGDLSEILLKGHLLVEHYLDHTMLLVYDKTAKLNRKSFHVKVTELKDKNCFWDHGSAVGCLYSLNKVRNEMAHRLDFEITLSQIDAIGYGLGKEYIMRRYAKDLNEKDLLLWVLDQIITMTYYPIWKAVIDEHKSKSKSS